MVPKFLDTTDLRRSERWNAMRPCLLSSPCTVEVPLDTPVFDERVAKQFVFEEGDTVKPLGPKYLCDGDDLTGT